MATVGIIKASGYDDRRTSRPDGVLNGFPAVEKIQHFGAAALRKKLDSLAGLGNIELGMGLNAGELVAISGLGVGEESRIES